MFCNHHQWAPFDAAMIKHVDAENHEHIYRVQLERCGRCGLVRTVVFELRCSSAPRAGDTHWEQLEVSFAGEEPAP